jgi:hypothetical protein
MPGIDCVVVLASEDGILQRPVFSKISRFSECEFHIGYPGSDIAPVEVTESI